MSETPFPGRLPDGVRRILSLLAPTVDGELIHLRDSQGEVRGLITGSTLHLEDRRFPEVRRVSVRKVGDLVAALLTLPPAASDSGTLLTHLGLFDYRIDPGGEVLLNLQGRDHVIGGVLYSHVGGYTSAERGTLHTRCVCNTGRPYRDSNRPTSAVSLMREIGRAAYHALPSPYTLALAEVRETRKKLDTAAQTLRQAQQVHGALKAQLEQAQAAAAAHVPAPLPLTAPGGGPDFYLTYDHPRHEQRVTAHDPATQKGVPFTRLSLHCTTQLSYGSDRLSCLDLAATILSAHLGPPPGGSPLTPLTHQPVHPEVQRLHHDFMLAFLAPLAVHGDHVIRAAAVRQWLQARSGEVAA